MNSKTFELKFKGVADFSDVQTNIATIQKALGKLNLPDSFKNNFTKTFSNLEKEFEKYQKFLNSGFKTKGDITGLEKAGTNISAETTGSR